MQQEETQEMATQAAAATMPTQPQPWQGATTPTVPVQPIPMVPVQPPPPPPPPAPFPYPWPMMMPPMTICRFGYRHLLFKLGFMGQVVATILFTVGYAVPFWADNTGLWMTCQGDSCDYYVGYGPEWLDTVRSLETVTLAFFVLSMVVMLYQEVFTSPPTSDNKVVELLGVVAGAFGVSGLILFALKMERKLKHHYDPLNNVDGFDYYYVKPDLTWGYWLATSGVTLGTLSSVLIAFSRIKHAKFTMMALSSRTVYTMPHSVYPAPPPMGRGYPAPAYPYPNPAAPVVMAPIPTMTAPAQGLPASQMTAAQEMPTSQMAAAQGMPASQMMAAQEMPASQMTAAQEIPASQMAVAQEMPASQMTAAQVMPTSQMMAAQEMPLSQMTAVQEMTVSQSTAVQEMPLSQMTAVQEMPASQMMAAQEMPASSAPGDRNEEAYAFECGHLSERL